jgi:YbgC/YbaW family acyl-CoA thioester hydrolase
MKAVKLAPITMTAAFDDSDQEGIVFFGNYFRLAHRAFEQFLPQLGIAWNEWFKHPDWGVPLRHVESDYLAPIHPGETFLVHISVDKIGESSVHFSYTFVGQDGQPRAKLKSSHVFLGRPSWKKINVPETLSQRLSAALSSIGQ